MTSAALDETVEFLQSPQALRSIARDPYWPKWDSPWWRMTLLWELGLARLIPAPAVDAMAEALARHYLPFFPVDPAELPAGADLQRDTACHCAVGTMHQVLAACGVDVEARLPWMTRWLLNYQLPDGGLNCEARAYRDSRKSSLVSTLPALEAVLGASARRPPSEAEQAFLDRGAAYLIEHRLARSRAGVLLERAWLEPAFPRFYDYDILRALDFLERWRRLRGGRVPADAIAEGLLILESAFGAGDVASRLPSWLSLRSLLPQTGGRWTLGPARLFPLLREWASPGPKDALTASWRRVRAWAAERLVQS